MIPMVKNINCPYCTNVSIVHNDAEEAARKQSRKNYPPEAEQACHQCLPKFERIEK